MAKLLPGDKTKLKWVKSTKNLTHYIILKCHQAARLKLGPVAHNNSLQRA